MPKTPEEAHVRPDNPLHVAQAALAATATGGLEFPSEAEMRRRQRELELRDRHRNAGRRRGRR